jgi:hypothetical protein
MKRGGKSFGDDGMMRGPRDGGVRGNKSSWMKNDFPFGG